MRAIRVQRLGRRVGLFDQRRRERADQRDAHAVGLDQKVGAHHADLQARRAGGIAAQRVGQAQRDAVHGAGGRHAERHEADPAKILQRVEQARTHDFQFGAHALFTSFAQSNVPASTSRAMRSIALAVDALEGKQIARRQEDRLLAALVEHPERRTADQVPAARALEGIDGRHVHGDGDRRTRHAHARLGAARQVERLLEACDVGQPRHEAQHVDLEGRGEVERDHLFRLLLGALGDLGEVGREFRRRRSSRGW